MPPCPSPRNARGTPRAVTPPPSTSRRRSPPSRGVRRAPLRGVVRLFDLLERWWESARTQRGVGALVVLAFVGALMAIELARRG